MEHEPTNPERLNNEPVQKSHLTNLNRRALLQTTVVALLSQILPKVAEAQEKLTNGVELQFEGDPKKHIPVSVQIDLGKDGERMIDFSADSNTPVELPPGEHTIDVRPQNPGEKAPTFRIETDGEMSPIQASPNVVTVKPGQKARLIIEEPLSVLPKLPILTLNTFDADSPQSKISLRESGSFHLPYIVEVSDADGKILFSLQSKPDGGLPDELDSLALTPGTVLIRVRPVHLHYPLTSRTSLRGGDSTIEASRTTNHSVVPIELKTGQTIEVEIGEGIESYNQVQGTFGDTRTLLLLNRPYAHENLGVDAAGKSTFETSDTHQYPNAIVALHELGADPASGKEGLQKACHALALQLEEGLRGEMENREEVPSNNVMIGTRRNHVEFLIACDSDGKIPAKIRTASKPELVTYIEGEILRMLAKPHRTSDALGVQELAHREKIDDQPNPSHISGFPAPKNRHMSKLDTLREVGPEYAQRWKETPKQ